MSAVAGRVTKLFVALAFLTAVAAPAGLRAEDAAPRKAPFWRLPDPDGHEWNADQFKGKVVVLDFWATWCPPCVKEMPGYLDLQKRYQDQGLAIIGVSVDESGAGTVRRFVRKNGITFPVLIGSWGLASGFGVTDQIPTTIIIDRNGFIRDRVVGYESEERLEKRLRPYLHPAP